MPSSAPRPKRLPSCRPAPWSAPPRCGARRRCRHARPDLQVVPMRGNVETRLRKLADGAADATLLACAGLKRLGLADRITSPISTDEMLPAVAQGAIGVETRADDAAMAELLAPINHEPTALAVTAERAFLAKLEGSCRTPIAGLAELVGGRLVFRGAILTPDGSQCHATRREGRPEEAHQACRGCRRRAAGEGRPRFLPRARLMRLLVTRPEPDALKLRAVLEERGHEATVEPLLTVSFDDTDPIDLEGVQAADRHQPQRPARAEVASPARRGAQAAAVRGRPGDGAGGARARLRDGRHGGRHGPAAGRPHRVGGRSRGRPDPSPRRRHADGRPHGRARVAGLPRGAAGGLSHAARQGAVGGNGRAAGDGGDRGRHLDVAPNGVNLCRAHAQAGARHRCPRARAFLSVGGSVAAARAAWARSAARLPRRPAWKKCLP